MSKEIREQINAFKQILNESENLNTSDVKNYETCWVITDSNGDIRYVAKSDEGRSEINKKGWYLDEYKLLDK